VRQIVIVAYTDTDGDGMQPVARDGELVVFADANRARAAAGPLGVAAPMSAESARALAGRYGLQVPEEVAA
jgi:hypothetical protein